MARRLRVNETVYVPRSRLSGVDRTGVALYRTTVLKVEGRKVKVSLRDGETSDWIGSALVHRDIGILLLNIGDFETEHALLDPLAKSIAQFCRLLVPDDQIRSIRVRCLDELKEFWRLNQAAYSHVIWIGHGSKTSLKFAIGGWQNADTLSSVLRVRGAPRKTYISLCCKTGYKGFGAVMSKASICGTFIGPFHSVEGAVASQFCQTFLTSHLLEGKTVKVAFRHARNAVPGSALFRLWMSGTLQSVN